MSLNSWLTTGMWWFTNILPLLSRPTFSICNTCSVQNSLPLTETQKACRNKAFADVTLPRECMSSL